MENSPYIVKAKSVLSSVAAKKLTAEERKDTAIELAGLMLQEAINQQTSREKKAMKQLSRMMNDDIGKVFTTSMTDQCFRSENPSRIADQMVHLIRKYGVPQFLDGQKKFELSAFRVFGKPFAWAMVPLAKRMLRKETSAVILPGEPALLSKHMKQRRKENIRVNLNHLGEAILGEEEALHRLQVYLKDLENPEVEYVSVKISTICSQINLLGWKETLNVLSNRLKRLYRAAKEHLYVRPDGTSVHKFVNLDMEEYRDLHLTVELFRVVLDDPEFFNYSAGIVLQSYLPDSFLIQQELTPWAMKRVAAGGAPIKIRIVKGANLAMEQVEASLRGWDQAPYAKKADVDANFKRMVAYGCKYEHAKAANLGIGSHNLFDLAYALILRAENKVEKFICFEMLEGMADHIRRVVQNVSGDMLLYCPAATRDEFQNAVAYLVRRLDENTAPENFLRHLFGLAPEKKEWEAQAALFSNACAAANEIDFLPRRRQNRLLEVLKESSGSPFQNEPDTDWALAQNRNWADNIISHWAHKTYSPIPLVINKQEEVSNNPVGIGESPCNPGKPLYQYALANREQVNAAVAAAEQAQKTWGAKSLKERVELLGEVAHLMRKRRGDLIGVMIADTGKTVAEADVEVSEAIDFAEYYRRNIEELCLLEDVRWSTKGPILVATPWNFPCSIPAGGILAALATGNTVIFKPASEAVLVGWELAKIFWDAGIEKDVLQFITCEDEPTGSQLVQDPRVQAVVLTGATSTAKLLLSLRPGLDLMAETGGKNSLIITNLADRDLAIKDLIHSAFGHAGQKCSACSLAICEKEVYDDPHFMRQLRDAAASLLVENPWNLSARVNPLIRAPGASLMRALRTLEEGEEWLLQPRQDPNNPNLWSPGIKIGVKPGGFTHQTELFGPVLGIIRAENLEEAVKIANATPYGLTSGIHSLDEREQSYWLKNILAGNLYINRGITGAVVLRQPFGGCKESSFGRGLKAGGPNYLLQFMNPKQIKLPSQKDVLSKRVQDFLQKVLKLDLNQEEKERTEAAAGNFAFFFNQYFSKDHDPSQILGQDNILRYVPQMGMTLRIQENDLLVDCVIACIAALTCGTDLQISIDLNDSRHTIIEGLLSQSKGLFLRKESESDFIKRCLSKEVQRVRLLSSPSSSLKEAFSRAATNLVLAPALPNGRLELLHYLREVSISRDYHRYGNLGDREGEQRAAKHTVCCANSRCD